MDETTQNILKITLWLIAGVSAFGAIVIARDVRNYGLKLSRSRTNRGGLDTPAPRRYKKEVATQTDWNQW